MIELLTKTDILNRGFVGIACIANVDKPQLLYSPKILQIDVFDKNKSPIIKDTQGTGTDIKSFNITCQKNSFIELKIDFTKDIKNITGLPQNLYLDRNYIKGTIQRSGKYLVNIIFQDDTDYSFILEVPNLQRIL